MVEEEHASLPVSRACELVAVSRSGLYGRVSHRQLKVREKGMAALARFM
jgi:hypothetical protein